jgi:3-phosphoshikimate 1-carboxyvinyltransferase
VSEARSVVPDVVELPATSTLAGTLRPPGDKSISHRAVLLAALAEGRSTIEGLSDGEDVARTIACVEALGAIVQMVDAGAAVVDGGRSRLSASDEILGCGNSGTTIRLVCGVAATIDGTHRLDGDASLRTRPMDRVATPLRAMGAEVAGVGEACTAPLEVRGGPLRAIRYELPVASAQVKSAVLLAGLRGDGPTTVIEPVPTRAHTEEMLADAKARVEVSFRPDGRHTTVWPSALAPAQWHVAADPSQAAFFVVAAVLAAAGNVEVHDVHVGEERLGFVGALARMGAHVVTRVRRSNDGDLLASSSSLRSTEIRAEEIPSLDEVPILAVAAAAAEGTTTFRGVAELRVKESDRLSATARLVRALGATASIDGDDLAVTGVGSAQSFARLEFDAKGDHRMAMAAAIAATVGAGGVVAGFAGVATSYPGFLADLASLR